MRDIEFRSKDLSKAEEILSQQFARISISTDCTNVLISMRRRCLGSMSFDELEFDGEIRFEMLPLDRVVLTRVRQGYLALGRTGGGAEVFTPKDQVVFIPTANACFGRLRGRYETITFDAAELTRVATTGKAAHEVAVQLTASRPVSAVTAQQLNAFVDYLRDHLLSAPEARDSPAITSYAASLLAASVLNTFPSNIEPTGTERIDAAKSNLVRAAAAFIERHAHTQITVNDIAAAIHVTPRALQHLFRRHLACSPTEYLRQVRLKRAHEELADADPDATSVAVIAGRWGFAHGGRFAAYYRQRYGQDPRITLRG